MVRLFNKEELIREIRKIFETGWIKSVKKTIDKRNDGAVGNTLEFLLGIKENNLPLPNAGVGTQRTKKTYFFFGDFKTYRTFTNWREDCFKCFAPFIRLEAQRGRKEISGYRKEFSVYYKRYCAYKSWL